MGSDIKHDKFGQITGNSTLNVKVCLILSRLWVFLLSTGILGTSCNQMNVHVDGQ